MKISLFAAFMMFSLTGLAQYKNDNLLYKTVYPQELCKTLEGSAGYLLLDVRSKGEFMDTSASPGYNLGALRNAVNINVRELGPRIGEISAYKNKPVYVYCSHSQRSRRASKMLADSGFTNVININGGVTAIRQLPEQECVNKLLETKVDYKIIPASSLCKKLMSGDPGLLVIDVRSDSAYNHTTRDAKVNAYGHFRKSVPIPLSRLESSLPAIPRDKEIILVDMYGDDAAKAAVILVKHNYKNVSILLEGIDRYLASDRRMVGCARETYISPVNYTIMSIADFKQFNASNPGYVSVDLRSEEEFRGNHKDNWRNIGQLINAVPIPSALLADRITALDPFKNKPIVLYAFGSSKEVYEAANLLHNKGFNKLIVLNGGLFSLRWTAANVEGAASLKDLVTNIPPENL